MKLKNLKPVIDQILPSMIRFRRQLHENPELGFKEYETSRRILGQLKTIPDLQIRSNMAETGIVATIDPEKAGPCVALRADMDALPIHEKTMRLYASKTPGQMHACGHDGHMACLVGAALVLSLIRDEISGPVKFIFQPAEESDGGARRMCEEGALENPKVDAVFGLHSYHGSGIQLGGAGVCRGAAMAGSGNFKIVIKGRGGHAAYPHLCIDPVFIGMQVGNALQSIVSRSTRPTESAVVTVSKFHAGTGINIIPDTAVLEGTFRSLSPKALKRVAEQIRSITLKTAEAFGADSEVLIEEGYPVLINHDRSTAIFEKIAVDVIPPPLLKLNFSPLMGCEDFACYAEKVPGTFWFLGIRPSEVLDYPPCHHATFDFNDDAIGVGIRMHCEIARQFARYW